MQIGRANVCENFSLRRKGCMTSEFNKVSQRIIHQFHLSSSGNSIRTINPKVDFALKQ